MLTPPELLRRHDDAQAWTDAERAQSWPSLPAAYADALAVNRLRMARGERPAGYKVGFTNRTIWERYQVFAPIWGVVWDSTLTRCDGRARLNIRGTCQPRLEPELAFGLRATPPEGATLAQLFDCVEWLAPSFEVVDTHCPDWKFSAAETVADGALHARLALGRATPVRRFAATGPALAALLADATVELRQDDRVVDRGQGCNVLDSPLHALLHFTHAHQATPGASPLQAGDIVSTGTWTDAWPLQAGQRWRSVFSAPLEGLDVEVFDGP
jgi:2-oxo-3-hexenedioate decarboxylase